MNDIEKIARGVFSAYPVSKAALFGSLANGTATSESDVDILVEFLPGTRGIEFFGLKTDLEDALERSVDLLTFRSLAGSKQSFRESVEKESRVIYEHENPEHFGTHA